MQKILKNAQNLEKYSGNPEKIISLGKIHENWETHSGKLGKIQARPKKRKKKKKLLTSFWLKNPEKYSRKIQKNTPQKTLPGGKNPFSNYAPHSVV